DPRPLRDLRAALGRVAAEPPAKASPAPAAASSSQGNGNGAGGMAGRYRDFVRKFGESLHQIEGALVRNHAPTRATGNVAHAPEGLIRLDVDIELRPEPPHARQDEEIVFIE